MLSSVEARYPLELDVQSTRLAMPCSSEVPRLDYSPKEFWGATAISHNPSVGLHSPHTPPSDDSFDPIVVLTTLDEDICGCRGYARCW